MPVTYLISVYKNYQYSKASQYTPLIFPYKLIPYYVRVVILAIRPNKCKSACGAAAHGERLPLAANCISMDTCAPWLYRVSLFFIRKADYLVGYLGISLRRAKRFAGQISALISSFQLIVCCGRVIAFAIQPTKCKSACGAAALEQRRSRLYVRGFRPLSRPPRSGGFESGFRLAANVKYFVE